MASHEDKDKIILVWEPVFISVEEGKKLFSATSYLAFGMAAPSLQNYAKACMELEMDKNASDEMASYASTSLFSQQVEIIPAPTQEIDDD